MLRFITLCLLLLGPALATANPCYQIGKDAERLACYDRMAACFGIENSSARLACMDQKVSNNTGPEKAPAAPVTNANSPPAAVTAAAGQTPADTSNFGLPAKQPEEMSSTIVRVERRFDGVEFITLANHQVWRETMDQTSRLKPGQRVTIKAGIFGSYTMHCEGVRRLIKVHRVK